MPRAPLIQYVSREELSVPGSNEAAVIVFGRGESPRGTFADRPTPSRGLEG